MLRTGRVVGVLDGEVEVCFERPEACARCGACTGHKHESLVKIPGDAPVGSWVDVDMPEAQVLKASLLAYVIPLVMLLAGLALGSVLFSNEMLWAATGVLFMGISWALLHVIDKKARRAGWQPRILAVHEEQPASEQ